MTNFECGISNAESVEIDCKHSSGIRHSTFEIPHSSFEIRHSKFARDSGSKPVPFQK
jgi:hypothetical protein